MFEQIMQWTLVAALWISVALLIKEYQRSRKLNQVIKEIRVEMQWQIMTLEKALKVKRDNNE